MTCERVFLIASKGGEYNSACSSPPLACYLMRQLIPFRFGSQQLAHHVLDMRRTQAVEFLQDRGCAVFNEAIRISTRANFHLAQQPFCFDHLQSRTPESPRHY